MRSRRLRELTPAGVARLQKRSAVARHTRLKARTAAGGGGGGASSPGGAARPRRRRGASVRAAHDMVTSRKEAVASVAPGACGDPVVSALAALPCGLSSVVKDDTLVCSICTEVLHQPVNGGTCSHVFCSPCLSTWLKKFAVSRAPCPLCRTTLASAPVADEAAQAKLQAVTVTCTCGASVVLALARCHAASCTHVAIASAEVAARGVTASPKKEAGVATAPPGRFACPLCPPPPAGQDVAPELRDEAGLIEHVMSVHADERRPAVCPLCASRPWGNPSHVSRNWAGHVALRHHGRRGDGDIDVAEFINRAEAAMMAAVMARSLAEAGIGAQDAAGGATAAAPRDGEGGMMLDFEGDGMYMDEDGGSDSESDGDGAF